MSKDAAARLLLETVRPVHDGLKELFGIPNPLEAEVLSIAAAYQESKCGVRDQMYNGKPPGVIGPATGFWQFERNGGVAEIMEARQTEDIARALAQRAGVAFTRDAIWRFFTSAQGDELAAVFARLLVWKDRASLPAASPAAADEAYRYYDRNWRPGAKRPQDWSTSWRIALEVVAENPATASAPLPAAPPVLSDALAERVARLERALAAMRQALE